MSKIKQGDVFSRRCNNSSPFPWSSLLVLEMDSRAVEKAKSRLRIAKHALGDLKTSKTFGEFSDHWYVFLTSTKNICTVLEQGSKTSPQSKQWFGSKKQIRKADSLLQYLYEARNDDEHGLGSSVDLLPEKHEIGVSGDGYSNSMVLNGGPFKDVFISGCETAIVFEGCAPPPDLRVTSLDGRPVRAMRTPATIFLTEVTARDGRAYAPPSIHLSQEISDNSPIAVANLAILYFEGLVEEASKLA